MHPSSSDVQNKNEGEYIMAIESGIDAIILLIGRLVFGGLLAFSGINHLFEYRRDGRVYSVERRACCQIRRRC